MAAPAPIYLQLFPWKEAQLQAGNLYEFSWHYELPVSPDDLWHYLIDSSRLNKAVGYDGIIYSEEGGLLHGASMQHRDEQIGHHAQKDVHV